MDYKNGKIYTIRSDSTDKYYIGSTTQPLSKRLSKHKEHYKIYLNGKYHNITSFEIVKYDDCYIELLEAYPCKSKDELTKREGELIRLHKNDIVNKRIEQRTYKQYRQDNKEKIAEQKKQYRQDNKEEIAEHKKQYYLNNIEKIAEHKKQYYLNNIEKIAEQMKQYQQDNKEKIAEHKKQYRQDNKDKIKARKSQRCICECGLEINYDHKSRHIKTKLHQSYMNNQNQFKLSQQDFNFIFECDSKMLLPKSYTNIEIIN